MVERSKCLYCGTVINPCAKGDHFIPQSVEVLLSRAGHAVANRLLPACSSCNNAAQNYLFWTAVDKLAFVRMRRKVSYSEPLLETIEIPANIRTLLLPKAPFSPYDIIRVIFRIDGDWRQEERYILRCNLSTPSLAQSKIGR